MELNRSGLKHRIWMKIAQSKLFNCFSIASLSWINRASGWISVNISFNEHFPEHFFLLVHIDFMNIELLTRSSVNVVESFSASSSLSCFIRTANFGPTFFHDLYPKFTGSVVVDYSSVFVLFNFWFSKAKLLNTLFIQVEREPVINNNFCWLTIYIKFHAINSEFIEFIDEEIISNSFTKLHHLFFTNFVFSKTRECR